MRPRWDFKNFKILSFMEKKKLIAIVVAILAVICGVVVYNFVKQEPPVEEPAPVVVTEPEVVEIDPVQYNSERFDELIDDIVVTIAYTAGFTNESYPTGERFAYGFNNTVVGKRLVKQGESTNKETARDITVKHLQQHVRPFLCYVSRQMTDGEIVAVSNFIYNVGGEAFSGYKADGKQIKKPSRLLTAINDGELPDVCARYFTGFRSCGGFIHEGLLKLRWLQAALFTEVVTPDDLRKANAVGIFGMRVPCLFENGCPDKDGYYTPKLNPEIAAKVLKQKGNGQKTEDLLK